MLSPNSPAVRRAGLEGQLLERPPRGVGVEYYSWLQEGLAMFLKVVRGDPMGQLYWVFPQNVVAKYYRICQGAPAKTWHHPGSSKLAYFPKLSDPGL